MKEHYVLVKMDFSLGNYQFHVLKSIEIGGILQVMTYGGDGAWRVIRKSLIEVCPSLAVSIAQAPRWTVLARSEDLNKIVEIQREEYIKYNTMNELTR